MVIENNNNVNPKNYVGIDLGKRTLEVKRINENDHVDSFSGTTNSKGLDKLLKWLNRKDVIALEAGNLAFRISRLLTDKGYEVIVVNPGDLDLIYRSLKKTDKEDALKLARLIKRIPKSELPVVCVPTQKEEHQRRLVSELAFQKKMRTQLINRLHALLAQSGLTDITKKDLKDNSKRQNIISSLNEYFVSEAKRLNWQIKHQDEALQKMNQEMKEALKSEPRLVKTYMSMPGIGHANALALLAYTKRDEESHVFGMWNLKVIRDFSWFS